MHQLMIFRLIILNGDRRGERVTVAPDPMRIGRDPACEININDTEIAALHAEIAHTPNGPRIRDLGSMNRILVNNHETREAQLKHGDVVEVGRTRFLIQAYVQAEVQGEAQEAKRRLWKKIAILVVALIILAVVTQRCRRHEPPKLATPPKAKPTPTQTASKTTPGATSEAAKPNGMESKRPSVNPVATLDPTSTTTSISVPPSLIPASMEEPAPASPLASTNLSTSSNTNDLAEAEALIAASRSNSIASEIELAQKELENASAVLLQSRVQEMMSEAQSAVSNRSLEEAEQVLAGIQRADPDFADAYLERASLFAERGRLEPAMSQLSTLVRRAPDSPAANKARAELTRLASARDHYVFPFAGHIKILSTEINKFPETAGQRELRILNATLESTGKDKTIDPGSVTVDVRFYDRNPTTGLIYPSTATLTPPPPIEGAWLDKTRKVISASYAVPANLQRSEHFYGCLVRVHYYGALQDEWMQPRDLPADVQMAPSESRSR